MDAAVIGDELQAFIASPVMMMICVAGPDGRPAIARGLGARTVDHGGAIELMISAAQWPEAAAGLTPNAQVAATFVQPATYESYQVKGRVRSLAPAQASDRAFAEAYMTSILGVLGGLGVRRHQVLAFLALKDPMRLCFVPETVFLQTPGPGSGRPLAEAS